MESTMLRQVIDHLAFLGYQDERSEMGGRPVRVARHAQKANLILMDFAGGVSVRTLYGVDEAAVKRDRLRFLEALNKFNADAAVSGIFQLGRDMLFICTWLPSYTREGFGNMLSALDHDCALLQSDEMQRFCE